jgi:hypothetical protein
MLTYADVCRDETMSRIPENFTVAFKLADDGFNANTAAGSSFFIVISLFCILCLCLVFLLLLCWW